MVLSSPLPGKFEPPTAPPTTWRMGWPDGSFHRLGRTRCAWQNRHTICRRHACACNPSAPVFITLGPGAGLQHYPGLHRIDRNPLHIWHPTHRAGTKNGTSGWRRRAWSSTMRSWCARTTIKRGTARAAPTKSSEPAAPAAPLAAMKWATSRRWAFTVVVWAWTMWSPGGSDVGGVGMAKQSVARNAWREV